MKKFFFLFLVFCCVNSAQAEMFTLDNHNNGYYFQTDETLIEMLKFSEKQVFNKVYKKDNINERLERLELAIYGAIQTGSEAMRIQNVKNSVTNVASGGKGLQYFAKSMDLSRNSDGGSYWSFGNSGFGYSNNYSNCRHGNCWGYKNSYNRHHSHRPTRHPHHSHRVHPPCAHRYNNNPIVNGDFLKDYSLGTSVRILND